MRLGVSVEPRAGHKLLKEGKPRTEHGPLLSEGCWVWLCLAWTGTEGLCINWQDFSKRGTAKDSLSPLVYLILPTEGVVPSLSDNSKNIFYLSNDLFADGIG